MVTLVGMGSGLVGSFLARAYLIKETFNFPLFNEVSITGDRIGSSKLIISEPKKVVVEQNIKIQETISSTKNNIVGIYKKNYQAATIDQSKNFDVNSYYLNNEQLAQGFILTTDGWLLSSYTPAEVKNLVNKKGDNTKNIIELLAGNYVAISSDKKVYEIDNFVYDKLSGFSFWRIKASGLPVKQFASPDETASGQQALAISNQGWAQVITIASHDTKGIVKSSDGYLDRLILNNELNNNFYGSFLVNLNGNLAAVIGNDGKILSCQSFINPFNGILKSQKITRPSLSVNYLSLSYLANYTENKGAVIQKNENGIAIASGGPAKDSRLKEGDIILAINNIEVNEDNQLNRLINNYQAGEEVEIKYISNQAIKNVKVKLGVFAN